MGSLLHVTKQLYVPIATMFNLSDAYVTSILNYGCEIWGFTNRKASNEYTEHTVNIYFMLK